MSAPKKYISNVRELKAFFEQEAKLNSNENLERGKAVEQQVLGTLRFEGIALHPQKSETPQADEAHSTLTMSTPVKIDLPDERCGGCVSCIASRKFKEDTQKLAASLSESSSSATTPAPTPATPTPAVPKPKPEVKEPEHYIEGKTFSAGQFGSVPEPAQGSNGDSDEEEMGEKIGVFLKISKIVQEQHERENIFESLFSDPAPPNKPSGAFIDALVDLIKSDMDSGSSSSSSKSYSSPLPRDPMPRPFDGCTVGMRQALMRVITEAKEDTADQVNGPGSGLSLGASGLQKEFDRLKGVASQKSGELADPCYAGGQPVKALHWVLRYPMSDALPQGTPVYVVRSLSRLENIEQGIPVEPHTKAYICAAQVGRNDFVSFFLTERKFLRQVTRAEFDGCVERREAHALAEFGVDADYVDYNAKPGIVVRCRRGTSLARNFPLAIFCGRTETSCGNLSMGNPSRYSGNNIELLMIGKDGQEIKRKVGPADICVFE